MTPRCVRVAVVRAIARLALCFVLIAVAASPSNLVAAESTGPLSFDGNTGWIGAPLDAQALHGKIVLVDFWEYTCINCLRTLPYLRAWYQRYAKYGFTIVGVHTPEFDFSGERSNVEAAMRRLHIQWPVVLDSNLAIWNRYHNDGWPHEYLYDRQGRLVESVFGEGGYQQTEMEIQKLLRADGIRDLPPVMALLPQDSYDKPGAVCYPQTPELVVQRVPVANAGAFEQPGVENRYDDNGSHRDGALYLQGYWKRTAHAVVATAPNDAATISYHAIQVVAVLKPENGTPVRVDVTQDGRAIARADAGVDLRYDANGHSYVDVDAARAYELVMNATFGHHELRLSPQGYGIGLYSFAFESCEVPHS
jgi:YD repeat-containing protein